MKIDFVIFQEESISFNLVNLKINCLLIGFEVLSDRRIAWEILVGRVYCAYLALLLRFEEVPYSRRRRNPTMELTMACTNR
jgi:hypothetical protein